MDGPDVGVCPGYLLQQPQVGEALALHLWWDKGQLRDRCGDEASPLVPLYVEQVAGAIAELGLAREARAEQERKLLANRER